MLNFCSHLVGACQDAHYDINLMQRTLASLCQDGRWLSMLHDHVGSAEETLLYCDDALTILHARLTPNIHFPPHEHGITAVIATYDGMETHHLYRPAGTGLEECGRVNARALDVSVFGSDVVHSIVNPGTRYSRSLHVYLGDLIGRTRRLWNHEGARCVNYTDEPYYDWAKPYDTSRSFLKPQTAALYGNLEAAPRAQTASAH